MGILSISAKCSDCCYTSFKADNGKVTDSDGYVPKGIGIDEYGDYVVLEIDMQTGQILNWKPVSDAKVIKTQKGT